MPTTEPEAKPVGVTMVLTHSEANLIKRARALTPGAHLVILSVDAHGLDEASFMAQAKVEHLRPLIERQKYIDLRAAAG